MRVLVVEDDLGLAQMLVEGLKHEGWQVDWAKDGYTALRFLMEKDYDLVLLDVMLPKLDGIRVCQRIRETKEIPVIMLTAKSQVEDKVEGLSAGADDYITKPFSFKELVARMKAVMRRYKKENDQTLSVGDLTIDLAQMSAYYKGRRLNLTGREFKLLKFLAENAGRALSREEIHAKVWGHSFEEGSNVVDVYVKNLRNKLGDKPPKLIHTIRGHGYMLKPEDDA